MDLFGTSGIRTVVDTNLIQLAQKVGFAVGKNCGNIVVGSDTRTSGDAIKHALISGLLATGSRCCDAGVIPTPTLAYATREFNAGIMITASHNPPEYNGMKFLNPDGSAFNYHQRKQIEEIISSNSFSVTPWDKITGFNTYAWAVEKHIERILRDFPTKIKLKVVVDCNLISIS